VHEEEVAGVLLLAHALDHTGGHGHRGYPRRPYHGVDLPAAHALHDLTEEHSPGSAEDEGYKAQEHYLEGGRREEVFGAHGGAHGKTQEDGGGVQDLVLGGLVEPLGDAALPEQVAEHEGAYQGDAHGQDEAGRYGGDYGEEDALNPAHGTEGVHADGTVGLCGEETDDRRLDEGHKGHVAVRRNRNRPKDLGRKLHGEVDAGRAVGAAYDGDGRCLFHREAHHHGAEEGDEYTKLRRRTKKEGERVRKEGRKVRQGSDSHEDDDRVDFVLRAVEEVSEEAPFVHDARQGQVDEEASEGYGYQEKGLKSPADGKVEEDEGDQEHGYVAPREPRKAGGTGKAAYGFKVDVH